MSKVRSWRNALRFMHGNILVLTVTGVLGMLGRAMAFPYASLFILSLGGEPAQIGLVNSLAPLAGLVMFPLGGYLADHSGRVKLIGLAGYLSGAIYLLYIFAPNWQVIALAGLLQGFMVVQFPPSSAIIADSLAPEDRGRGIATMNTIAGALAVFCPYLAGSVLDALGANVGMRYLYGFLMVVYMASAAINLRFLSETLPPSRGKLRLPDVPTMLRTAYGGIPEMLRRLPRSFRALAAVVILGFMANGIAGPFWVIYAVQQIGLSSAQWGLILLVETALRNVMYTPAGVMVDRHGRTKFMLASLLLCLVSMPLFVFSATFAQVLLIRALVAISNAFFIPACAALMADIVPREIRGRVMAAIGRGTVMIGAASGGTGGPGLGFLMTIPLMIASLSGGYLYTLSPAYPWFFVTIATAIALILSAMFVRDPRKAEV